jgi:hypothetical protein
VCQEIIKTPCPRWRGSSCAYLNCALSTTSAAAAAAAAASSASKASALPYPSASVSLWMPQSNFRKVLYLDRRGTCIFTRRRSPAMPCGARGRQRCPWMRCTPFAERFKCACRLANSRMRACGQAGRAGPQTVRKIPRASSNARRHCQARGCHGGPGNAAPLRSAASKGLLHPRACSNLHTGRPCAQNQVPWIAGVRVYTAARVDGVARQGEVP